MNQIWDRKSFEVAGHWPLWRGWKNKWPRRTNKSRTLKKSIKNYHTDKWIGYLRYAFTDCCTSIKHFFFPKECFGYMWYIHITFWAWNHLNDVSVCKRINSPRSCNWKMPDFVSNCFKHQLQFHSDTWLSMWFSVK